MNILHLLKSRIGAVSKGGLLGMVVSIGLAGVTIHNYVTSTPSAQQQQVRSLASIMSSGEDMPREFRSMHFSIGNNRFATAEERAKREGQLFDGGEDAVEALEGFKVASNGRVGGIGNIEGSALGAGENGLGFNNEKEEIAGGGRVRGAAQRGSTEGVDAAAAGQEKKEGKQLQRAAVTHYSGGSNFSGGTSLGGSNSSASGAAGRRSSSARGEGQSRIGANSINGAMPGGTSRLVSASPKFQGAHSSSFVDTTGRKSHEGTGTASAAGQTLKDLALRSGKVASKAHRSANAGAAEVFMYGGERGLQVFEDGMVAGASFGGQGDATYSTAGDPQISSMEEAVDDTEAYEKEKRNHRDRLLQNMLVLMLATFVAMVAISKLAQGDVWSKVAAAVITAAMVVAIALFIVDACKYADKYDEWGHGAGFIISGAVMFTGLGIAWSGTTNGWLQKVADFFGRNMGLKLIGGTISSIFMGKALTSIKDSADAISEGYQDKSSLSKE